MYLPRSFVETDLVALDKLVARDNFVTLVTVRDGNPVVNHLPVLYQRMGEEILLRGHWSRANPQGRDGGRATVIVNGPHAYVSPAWYPDKEPAARVPTWNYAVAHLEGQLSIFQGEAELGALVGELTHQHESRAGSDWRYDHERDELRSQLRGITGFRLVVDKVQLKFKLNQNHPLANRASVAEALASQPREASREVAQLMRARLPDALKED
ncbi:MAG: PaiB family transcriptional regulator [Xanthomonadaceae bacterium]|nr:PaiB family transcriptional regulator [Xanthomonadaceae bacterium]